MGKRGETARDEVLKRAKAQVDIAAFERDLKRAEADKAQVYYDARKEIYEQLAFALAPKPRSNGSGSAPKPKRASKAAADTKCSKCGETADGALHGTGYIDSHPFAPSSAAPSAKRKSSSASASKKDGDRNLSAETMNVSSVSNVEGNPNEVS